MDLSVIINTILYVFITYIQKCVVIVNLTEIKVHLYKPAKYYFSSKLGLLCKNVEDCYGVFDPEYFNT